MNPAIPPEVLNIILSNCAKRDLIRIRLTCRTWNAFCLKKLDDSGHTIDLPCDNVKGFVEFLKDTGSRPFLPFKIIAEKHNVSDLVTHVESIVGYIGEIQLKCMDYPSWFKILCSLKKLAPFLRTLEVTHYPLISFFQEHGQILANTSFPKLKSLSVGFDSCQNINGASFQFPSDFDTAAKPWISKPPKTTIPIKNFFQPILVPNVWAFLSKGPP